MTRPSAAKALSRPPVATLPARAGTASTEPRIAERIWPAEALGRTDAKSATVPVTCGAAIDVPEMAP